MFGGIAMELTEYFVNRARECQELAQSSRDPDSKATWNQFAERWREAAHRSSDAISAATAHSRTRQREAKTS
jgi:hypothetical protein